MNPILAAAVAVVAAFTAAAIGLYLHPARRAQRRAQREQKAAVRRRNLELAIARRQVHGRFAVHPDTWERFWDAHQLDDCHPTGGA